MVKSVSSVLVLTPGKPPRQLEELTMDEMDEYLRNVIVEDGQYMLIHSVYPLAKALRRANKRIEEMEHAK